MEADKWIRDIYKKKRHLAYRIDSPNSSKKLKLKMVTLSTLRNIALSFPETTEEPHFKKTSFRVKKKIFVSYDDKNKRACLKLSEIDQDIFVLADRASIYPVDNKWGKQGWTIIELSKVNKDLFADALTTAYCEVAPQYLADQIRMNDNE